MTGALLASLAVNVALTAGVVTTGVTTHQLSARVDAVEAEMQQEPAAGPRGPQGPPGPAGPPGQDGLDGADGQDGQQCTAGLLPTRLRVVTDVRYGFAFRDDALPPLSVDTRFIEVCP